MLINELSKRTGVSVHTIRYYENLRLLQGSADENVKTNTYKNYDESAVERLEIIIEAKEVGFSLAEIRNLLDNWYSDLPSTEAQVKMFTEKIKEVTGKIQQLKKVKKRLENVVSELKNGKC